MAGAFVIKAAVVALDADRFDFPAQKTMYGGKRIAPGDTIFLFASETSGGCGLFAQGEVVAAGAVARPVGVTRWTPRVDVTVAAKERASRALGREELTRFRTWDDGRPETELNFKLYRQATDKIVGVSEGAAAFLRSLFDTVGLHRSG